MSAYVAEALMFEYDVPADRWSWSPGLRRLHGLAPDQTPTTALLLSHVIDEQRDTVRQTLAECSTVAGCYSFAYRMRDGGGALRQVRYVAQAEAGGDQVKRLHGFVVDITDSLRDHADLAVAKAVEHRAVVEQAKGALMVCLGIDDHAAFELLRGYSSRTNTKLVEVAQYITNGVSDNRFSREGPVRTLLDILLELEGTR